MPEWEAFYFHKFFLNGYLVCISKMVRFSAFCWNNLLGVGRVQKIWVDYSQIKTRLDIEPSRHLVSTITGNDIQYGGSRKRKKYKDKSFELLELAVVST